MSSCPLAGISPPLTPSCPDCRVISGWFAPVSAAAKIRLGCHVLVPDSILWCGGSAPDANDQCPQSLSVTCSRRLKSSMSSVHQLRHLASHDLFALHGSSSYKFCLIHVLAAELGRDWRLQSYQYVVSCFACQFRTYATCVHIRTVLSMSSS